MTITVLHMRRLDPLTESVLMTRYHRGERKGPDLAEIGMREQVRSPSLGWSLEQLEEASRDPVRQSYVAGLALLRRSWATALYLEQGYVPVAQIATDDLGTAFTLTSSYEGPWTEGRDPRLTVLDASRATSSQVGDLLRDDATGEIHLCAGDGYVNLGVLDHPLAA
jgi:hypothetical protein